jgi:hypothetical protein
MVSKGIKINELPINHLAKTFYFVLFILKAKFKNLAVFANNHKPFDLELISYVLCTVLASFTFYSVYLIIAQ